MAYLEPSERIVNLFRDVFKDGPFKAIYDGDPDEIPRSNLPAICVLQLDDENGLGATGQDDVSWTGQIRVVFNKKDDWGVRTDKVDLTDRKIRRIVEERDDNNKYLPTTIKGALRTKLTLEDGAILNQAMRFELGSVLRPNDIVTREGHLTISIDYTVPVTRSA